MTHDQREIHRKKRILEYAERVGNITDCTIDGVLRRHRRPFARPAIPLGICVSG
jgi:hypothetical protein